MCSIGPKIMLHRLVRKSRVRKKTNQCADAAAGSGAKPFADFSARCPAGGFSRGGDEEMDGARWGHRHASPSHQQSLPEPTEQPMPPVERKKLVLAPRSKPLGADTETSATETSHAVDKPTKVHPPSRTHASKAIASSCGEGVRLLRQLCGAVEPVWGSEASGCLCQAA